MFEIDPELALASLLKGLDILGIVFVVGLLAFRQLVLPSSLQAILDVSIQKRLEKDETHHSSRRLFFFLCALMALQFVILFHQSETRSSLLFFLFLTPLGWIWGGKFILLSLFFILLRSHSASKDSILFGAGCLLCLTGSLSGHARERWAYDLLLTDWLHFTAVSIWVGGLIPLLSISRRSRLWLAPVPWAAFLSRLIETFSLWAILCVATILMTGSFNALVYLRPKGVIVMPEYEKILLLKVSFVLIVLVLGGVSRFFILPRLRKIKTDTAQTVFKLEKCFFLVVTMEFVVALVVLVLAAVLTQSKPPCVWTC